MFLKKIKELIHENRVSHKNNNLQLKELEWAHIYHDSIRGKPYLLNLSLNIGRWAGNYTFFYVLNRILHDFKPKTIVEFGLGESSKFISSCISGINFETNHYIIEQSKEWKLQFQSKFELSKHSEILYTPLEVKKIKGFEVNTYKNLQNILNFNAELYIVDGPFGSDRYSRYDIYFLAEKFNKSSEFIILIDDSHRKGEWDTFLDLKGLFDDKGINYFTITYKSIKNVSLLVSEKYKYVTTL